MSSPKEMSNQTTLMKTRTPSPNCPETLAKDRSMTMISATTKWMDQSLLSQAKLAQTDKPRAPRRKHAKANQLTTKICSFLALTGKLPEISWRCRSLNSSKPQSYPSKTSVIPMKKESPSHSNSLWLTSNNAREKARSYKKKVRLQLKICTKEITINLTSTQ
jgi:hypothetical protein